MLVYQAIIMLAVVAAVFVLVFIVKLKQRTLLALIIIALVVGGSLLISMIQYYFGVRYTEQKLDTATYASLRLTQEQKENLRGLLPGWTDVTARENQCKAAYSKVYDIDGHGVRSSVRVTMQLYKSEEAAGVYFHDRQLFYESFQENNTSIFEDKKRTRKLPVNGSTQRYITSYIRSNYPNYNEPLYLPSRMYYLSEVIIVDDDLVVDLYERTNKPVTEKSVVLAELAKAFGGGAAPAAAGSSAP